MPRVSVVIPSHNHAPFVKAAIESVLKQTFQDFELVVTDDGSTDGTADIVAAIPDPRIHLRRFPAYRSAAIACNDALRRAQGDYLAVLDPNHMFAPKKLEQQVAFLDANPDIGAVFSRAIIADEHGQAMDPSQLLSGNIFDVPNRSQAEWLHQFFFTGDCLCHSTMLIRRDCLAKVGLYDARFKSLSEMHMGIRLAAAYKIHILSDRLIAFRHLPNDEVSNTRRTDNVLRFNWENPQVLKLYTDLPPALFDSVFAREFAVLNFDPKQDRRIALGRLCIATNNLTLYRLGLDLLFDALPQDDDEALGRFRHADFHSQATGARDIYNLIPMHHMARIEKELSELKAAALAKPPAALSAGPAVVTRSGDDSRPSLVVLDDIFPHVLSAFRLEEYLCYLEEWPDARVYSTGAAFLAVNEFRSITEVIAEFESNHPAYRGRVLPLTAGSFPSARRYYMIFLNIIYDNLANIEREGAPFVFTLYPGGGFTLNQADSDAKLERVLRSPFFSHVIATQPIIQDYLLKKNLCRPDQIVPVFGGVLPRAVFEAPPQKQRFLRDKIHADLCFVANRYMPGGFDKGYDLFVETAKILIGAGLPIRCHVVGPWDASIIPLGAIEPNFHFYGLRPTSFFRDFYAQMDAILSPNRPFVLVPGAFDGFPTACCAEAGLQAVAVLCTDELNLNRCLRDGIDFCLIRPDVTDIVSKVAKLISEPGLLEQMGQSGRDRMLEHYSPSRQIQPRIDVLRAI